MDYCAKCGQTAEARCPLDGTFVCKRHAAQYPMYTISRLEDVKDPNRRSQLFPQSVSVCRSDGSVWEVGGHEHIEVCADCIDRTIAELVPQFASALLRRHRSREHATIAFIETGLEWQNLNQGYIAEYQSKVFGDQVIRAMGDPPPVWLRPTAQNTLAALYAELARHRKVEPQAVAYVQQQVPAPSFFNKNRTEARRVPSAFAWAIEYVADVEWGRKGMAYIRADGDLRMVPRGSEDLSDWAQGCSTGDEHIGAHYPSSHKPMVEALTAAVKGLLN